MHRSIGTYKLAAPVAATHIPEIHTPQISLRYSPTWNGGARRRTVFEVGKYYRFTMWAPGPNGGTIAERPQVKITDVDLPLVRVSTIAGDAVINAASMAFVSAREIKPDEE
jgi:hypothetical protein